MTVGAAMNSLFVPLTHRPYRRLWIAQVFSDFGNFFDFVALEALIVVLSGGWVPAPWPPLPLRSAPWILVGPWIALLADRVSKKRLMLFCVFCASPS